MHWHVATVRLFLVAHGWFWGRSACTRCALHADVRHVARFARDADCDAQTDASRVLRKKCQVPRVQNSGVVWSLNMIVGVLESF